jgi:hypothetical protein
MKFLPKDPPRRFTVGSSVKFDMKDCGTLALTPDEQITLVTEKGAEYDVARKDWGFYATPSRTVRFTGSAHQEPGNGPLLRTAGRARPRACLRDVLRAGESCRDHLA